MMEISLKFGMLATLCLTSLLLRSQISTEPTNAVPSLPVPPNAKRDTSSKLATIGPIN